MIGTLCWKEYREHRTIWLAMAVLTLGPLYALVALYAPQGSASADTDKLTAMALFAVGMVAVYGLVCGATMFAGEKEANTQTFIDALTGRRSRVWWTKVFMGFVLTLAEAVLVMALVLVWDIGRVSSPLLVAEYWYVALPVIALTFYGWGLFTSSFMNNALPAAGVAALFVVASWLPSGIIFVITGLNPLVSQIVIGLMMGLFSRTVFCKDDAGRLSTVGWSWDREKRKKNVADFNRDGVAANAVAVAARVVVAAPPMRVPLGYRTLIWLSWLQGRGTFWTLMVVGLFFGFLTPVVGILAWPFITLLVGVTCGGMVFAPEAASGSYKFLGDQRVPPGRVWLAKVGTWAVLAGIVCLAVLIGMALQILVQVAKSGGAPQIGQQIARRADVLSPESRPAFIIGVLVFFAMWLPYGFSVSQFFTLVMKKTAVAVLLSLAVSVLLAVVWVPALVNGGLSIWQVLFVPALLLFACRAVMWAWMSERLKTWRSIAFLIGCWQLIVLWIAGSMAWRVYEVPEVGEPFDVKAYLASVPVDNEAGLLVRQAGARVQELQRHVDAAASVVDDRIRRARELRENAQRRVPLQPPAPDPIRDVRQPPPDVPIPDLAAIEKLRSPNTASNSAIALQAYNDGLRTVLAMGWPAESPAWEPWLNYSCNADWIDMLRQAADKPLGIIENPRALTLSSNQVNFLAVRQCALLLAARALQLQARGRDGEALEHIALIFTVARNARNYPTEQTLLSAVAAENNALQALDQWLVRVGNRPELVRQALEMLNRHERELPPFTDLLKTEYVLLKGALDDPTFLQRQLNLRAPLNQAVGGDLITTGREMPWEKMRSERIFNAVEAGEFRAAERDYRETLREVVNILRTPDESRPSLRHPLSPTNWQAAASGPDAALTRERLHDLVSRSWLLLLLDNFAVDQFRRADIAALCRLRAERLKVALFLYQMENGTRADRLDQLVPRYLAELPLDPFSGNTFGYRVSGEEEIPVFPKTGLPDEDAPLTVPAGHGILWSVGFDLADQGGMRHTRPDRLGIGTDPVTWLREEVDWVFVVPAVAKK